MKEKRINYLQVLYYTVAGVVVGILVGAIDAVFGRVLLAITDFRGQHAMVLVPFLGAAGVLILFLYQKFSPKAQKGMGLIFDTGFEKNEKIPPALVPLIMVSTWLTHLFGGSAGREGVAVQIGATLSHAVGRCLEKTPLGKTVSLHHGRIFLIIGMAAGFGGLFQTPLAATFFSLEVLVAGALFYEALLPAMLAAFTASFTSHLLGLEKFSVAVTDALHYNAETIVKLIVTAVIFGIAGGVFSYFLALAKEKMAAWIHQPYVRILVSGIGLSVVFLLLFRGRYCGLGTNLIAASFQGETVYAFDFVLKAALTIVTLAAGFQGGEVTPLFAIGATLGVVLATAFGLPVMLVAALGYAAVFGSATNTLLAPILIGIEVFGAEQAIPFAIVCMIAFVCNGNRTIYGKQRISQMLDFEKK